jgi:RNA polymerase sigma factor (sigma-70 family)
MEAGAADVRPVGAPRGMLRVWGDERLVVRVRGGDDRAFEAIYDRHHRGLLSFCRHMLGNREEAEDALQHTFAAAHRALVRSESPIQLKAWLYAIARNHCLSLLRARRETAPLEEEPAALEGLAAEVERRVELRALVGDVQRLPDDQRAALVLAELGAHSHDEIAVILGVRRDKVKALVFQARESLMASRQARETSCQDIREQLSVLRGGALRRASLRRHVDACVGCQAFRAEVSRQRAALALVLPVAPSMALKSSVLGPVLGAGAACAAAAGVAGTASTAGGGLSLAGKALATKALVAAAVAGGVGGGAVAVEEISQHTAPPPARVVRAAPTAREPAPPHVPAPSVSPRSAVRHSLPAGDHERAERQARNGPARRRRGHRAAPAPPGPSAIAPAPAVSAAPFGGPAPGAPLDTPARPTPAVRPAAPIGRGQRHGRGGKPVGAAKRHRGGGRKAPATPTGGKHPAADRGGTPPAAVPRPGKPARDRAPGQRGKNGRPDKAPKQKHKRGVNGKPAASPAPAPAPSDPGQPGPPGAGTAAPEVSAPLVVAGEQPAGRPGPDLGKGNAKNRGGGSADKTGKHGSDDGD